MEAVTVERLPRIVQFVGTDDTGPDSGAECPHCGARGRYIHTFVTEGGDRRSAMSGCIKLFPVSPVALEHKRLVDKEARYRKNGWRLNRADSEAMDAIEAFYAGHGSEQRALDMCRWAKNANAGRWRR